ncbi:MAG: peptidylprolyl isomerase [Myxococcales bacterium]|nr:peptidylprolyl isomerase [Myxococcales bacterium]
MTSEPYPKATWRLAPDRLEEVALRVSHILILHEQSRPEDAGNLRLAGWRPDAPSTRTRQAARQLALEVARKAHRAPETFANLARKYSEDRVTAPAGGCFGTWSAPLIPALFLDALATLQPGQVSRVIDGPLGFHILKLEQPTEEVRLSARQIVIAYDGVANMAKYRRGRDRSRSRAQAKALSEALVVQLREHPDAFESLAKRHSDHMSGEVGGDIGVWSTHHAYLYSRELEAASRLPVRGISVPLDGPFGFTVVQRTPLREREPLATTFIRVAYSDESSLLPSRTEARKLIDELHAQLVADPSRFADLQQAHCCGHVQQWVDGQDMFGMAPHVQRLKIGEFSPAPVEGYGDTFEIFKRVAPKPTEPRPKLKFRLPSPDSPDLELLARNAMGGPGVAEYLGSLAARANGMDSLSEVQSAALQRVLSELSSGLQAPEESARVAALRKARVRLGEELGPGLSQAVEQSIASVIASEMMEN